MAQTPWPSGKIPHTEFVSIFAEAVQANKSSFFFGSGVSLYNDYPRWPQLINQFGRNLGLQRSHNASADESLDTVQYWLNQQLSMTDGDHQQRDVAMAAFLSNNANFPVPGSAVRLRPNPTIEAVATLGSKSLWTTNYDTLIEDTLSRRSIPHRVLTTNVRPSNSENVDQVTVYKMHGCQRSWRDIIIAREHYELYRTRHGRYFYLLAGQLMENCFLFLGFGFNDPNLRQILAIVDQAYESFPNDRPLHFRFERRPPEAAQLLEHEYQCKELRRHGIVTIEIQDYPEIPHILDQINRRLLRTSIFLSGAFPTDDQIRHLSDPISADELVRREEKSAKIGQLSTRLGESIALCGMALRTGGGLTVGNKAISGFLTQLQKKSTNDTVFLKSFQNRFYSREFPQDIENSNLRNVLAYKIREDLVSKAGIVIYLSGEKVLDGKLVLSNGLEDEFEIVKRMKRYPIIVGWFGGMSCKIHAKVMSNFEEFFPKPVAIVPEEAQQARSLYEQFKTTYERLGPEVQTSLLNIDTCCGLIWDIYQYIVENDPRKYESSRTTLQEHITATTNL